MGEGKRFTEEFELAVIKQVVERDLGTRNISYRFPYTYLNTIFTYVWRSNEIAS